MNDRVLEAGRNCWCVAGCERAAVLIDGERYFAAFREAVLNARRSIWIIGWDIHGRVELVREGQGDDETAASSLAPSAPSVLEDLLCHVLEERAELDIRVLVWDFAMIYALERDWLPLYSLAYRSHPRLEFRMDGAHPIGASQHQKLVVVDNAVAFVGGMDLSKWRWDTPEHRADDPRRADPFGKHYPPYHDVQLLVDGEAAQRIGELARERWRCATERGLPELAEIPHDPWPASVEPDFRDVEIAIARTSPAYGTRPEIREVERLYLDAIAAARRSIYIENQYFTAHAVAEALERRLIEAEGPEVLVVLPRETGGWLEQNTMDVLRSRVLEKLRGADRHGRFRVVYPTIPGLDCGCLSVHSKLMIVDDTLFRVGSANLSNRSMGFDSECDIAIEGHDAKYRDRIRRIRDTLLAEHLGATPDDVAEAIDRTGSMLRGVERLAGRERSLVELDAKVPPHVDRLVPESAVIDPERPVDVDEIVEQFVGKTSRSSMKRRFVFGAALLLALGLLVVLWRWTPLRDWLTPETLARGLESLQVGPLQGVLAVAAFTAGTSVGIPFGVLVAASAIVFGPWWGAAISLVGGWLASLFGYGAGKVAGRNLVRKVAGDKLNRLSRKLAERGVITVVAVRLLPVAPFVIVNLVAGASHVSLRDFALGSVIGLLPGVVLMTFLGAGASGLVRDPWSGSTLIFLALAVVLGAATFLAVRFLKRRYRPQNVGGAS